MLLFFISLPVFADRFENRFEDEFKIIEKKDSAAVLDPDEDSVSFKSSAIKKEEIKKEEDSELTNDQLFFKTKEVKPRRVRSR